jgi:NAD(P)-dependent dehydrogenase (short-subunit alcohol dehydrogenase family)
MAREQGGGRPRDLEDRTFLVTGANAGIGRATAAALAARGARLWLACRSLEKGRAARDEIRERTGAPVELLHLDLEDLASVRACAAAFLAASPTLDVLVNNAGIAWRPGGATRQGFELFFGVNYLAPFLLTSLLLPALQRAEQQQHPLGARIVNVSSMAHYEATSIDWDALRRPTVHPLGRPEYCVSKLCNVLHARELARRFAPTGPRAYALHPGVVDSEIWEGLPRLTRWKTKLRWRLRGRMVSTEQGARTTLHCAASSEAAAQSGLYYDDCRPRAPSPIAEDAELARELWRRSEEWTS